MKNLRVTNGQHNAAQDAARILSIDSRARSIDAFWDADIALCGGDPFEYTTHCVGVVIDGAVVSEGER